MGAITKAFVDFIAGDPEIAELTAQFGFTSLSSPAGFVASMDALAVVVVCLYVVLGIHHLGEDELADRLDLVYAAPVSRTSWLTGGTVATGATAMVAMLAIGLGTWLGVAVTGVDFGLGESMAAILNCLPLVVLSLGLAVGVHGVRPGWVVPVAGGAVVVLYLLSFLGPAMDAPEWLIDVSPWAHVSVAPADPVNWAGTVVMVLIGVVLWAPPGSSATPVGTSSSAATSRPPGRHAPAGRHRAGSATISWRPGTPGRRPPRHRARRAATARRRSWCRGCRHPARCGPASSPRRRPTPAWCGARRA